MAKKQVLDIFSVLAAMDRKDRKYYSKLSEKEQKAVAPFVLARWASAVNGSQELQEWYLMATNERVNKDFFLFPMAEHKELMWLLLTTISPGMGKQRHQWIPPKRNDVDKKSKLLLEFFPDCPNEELQTLNHIYSVDDIKQLAKDRGWDDKRIKKEIRV